MKKMFRNPVFFVNLLAILILFFMLAKHLFSNEIALWILLLCGALLALILIFFRDKLNKKMSYNEKKKKLPPDLDDTTERTEVNNIR